MSSKSGSTSVPVQYAAAGGIGPDRVEFVGRQQYRDYFRTYDQIDIALDPFPYSGGTTTCDALWMGVPVVTLAGSIPPHRGGVSVLSNSGVPEWITSTPDQYIATAVALAGDVPGLCSLRTSLRGQMNRSPIADAARNANGLEAAFRQMWAQWCNSP